MAKVMRSMKPEERKEHGGMVPFRGQLEHFPQRLIERIDEILGERWTPWWPALRWPEELLRAPAVDVFEEGEQVVIKAELPGMKKEEIEVQVMGDTLTISGKKEKEEKVERKDYYRFERSAGAFSRSIRLPSEVQAEKVTAQLKEGVLEIRAPKTEAAREMTHKIEVT